MTTLELFNSLNVGDVVVFDFDKEGEEHKIKKVNQWKAYLGRYFVVDNYICYYEKHEDCVNWQLQIVKIITDYFIYEKRGSSWSKKKK